MRIVSDGFHRKFFLLILWASPLLLFAQKELPNQVLPSPIAMQFQKYGDYPVSYYTGIPDIKVPIYTIKEGDIEVPIYLSFHASGLNLNEQQGIVGYGWTLNTGGVISRTINGFADESWPYMNVPDLESLYVGSMWASYSGMAGICNDTDHEYDVYNYTIPSHSGKYIPNFFREGDLFGEYGFSFLMKADNVRIYPGNKIIDEKGINYYFGGDGGEEYQEYSIPTWPFTAGVISSWYLGAITSTIHPGMGVSYEYQAGPILNVNKYSKTWKLDDYYFVPERGYHQTAEEHQNIINESFPYNPKGAYNAPFSYIGSAYKREYNSVVPKKILFSDGYLKFYLDGSKHLQKIEIYNKKNELLKTVDLVLENFNAWTLPSKYRKLKSVTFKDTNGGNVETYSFNYYNEGTQIDNYSGRDHWGFYNGAYLSGTDNHTMSYNYPYQFFDGENHIGTVNYGQTGYTRDPNPNYAKTFMLQKMTYPTGGYTTFDYEGNQLGYIDQWTTGSLQLVGGLRIKEINSYGHNDQLLKSKQYTYKSKWQTESGVDNTPRKLYQEHAVVENVAYFLARRVSIYEDIPLNLFPKGAPIGYYEVKETEGDASTTYGFDDNDAFTYSEVTEPGVFHYGPFGEFFFKRMTHKYKPWNFGNLISKEIIAPGLRKVEYYTYQDSIQKTIYDWNMYQNMFASNGGGSSYHSSSSDFNFMKRYYYSGFKRLQSKSTYEDISGTYISSTENYQYSNPYYPLQISSKQRIDSQGDTVRTDYKYANNYIGSPIYADMDMKNMTGEVLEETEINISQNKELKKLKRDYAYYSPNLVDTMVQLKSIRASVGGALLDTLVKVEKYDSKGRILQYRDKNKQVNSLLYLYGEQYPTASLTGVTYNQILAAINFNLPNIPFPYSNFLLYFTSRFNLYLPNAQYKIYEYIPGVGVKTETDTRGRTTSYEYDSFQRLKLVRDSEGKIVKQYNYHLRTNTP